MVGLNNISKYMYMYDHISIHSKSNLAVNFFFISLGFCDLLHIVNMCGLSMSMLGPQEEFPFLTVSITASGKPSRMLMGRTKAMKKKRGRTKLSKISSKYITKVCIITIIICIFQR